MDGQKAHVPGREHTTANSAVHVDAHTPWCPPALGCSYLTLVSLSSRLLLRSSKEGKQSVPHFHAFSVEQLWVSAHPGQWPFLRRAAGLSALSLGCRMAMLTKSPFAHWLDTCFLNEFLGSFVMVIFLRICILNRRVAFFFLFCQRSHSWYVLTAFFLMPTGSTRGRPQDPAVRSRDSPEAFFQWNGKHMAMSAFTIH